MNEDLLNELHLYLGGEDAIKYDDFKKEFSTSSELQRMLFDDAIGGEKVMRFNDFLSEAGIGSTTKRGNIPAKPIVQTQGTGTNLLADAMNRNREIVKSQKAPVISKTNIGGGRAISERAPEIDWGKQQAITQKPQFVAATPEEGEQDMGIGFTPGGVGFTAGRVNTGRNISSQELIERDKLVEANTDVMYNDNINEAYNALSSIDTENLKKYKPVAAREYTDGSIDWDNQEVTSVEKFVYPNTKDNTTEDDFYKARAELAQLVSANNTILESTNHFLEKDFGKNWLNDVSSIYNQMNPVVNTLNALSKTLEAKLGQTQGGAEIKGHRELLNQYNEKKGNYSNIINNYNSLQASLGSINKEIEVLSEQYKNEEITYEDYQRGYTDLVKSFEEGKVSAETLAQQSDEVFKELEAIREQEKTLISSFKPTKEEDPDLKLYNTMLRRYDSLKEQVKKYEDNPNFEAYSKAYNDVQDVQGAYGNLFKDKEEKKAEAKRLQDLSDYYVKNYNTNKQATIPVAFGLTTDDLNKVRDDIGFAIRNVFTDDLATGPLSIGMKNLKSFAAKFVGDVVSIPAAISLKAGVTPDFNNKITYGDFFSLETLKQEADLNKKSLRSDMQGGFRETEFKLDLGVDKKLASLNIFKEGDKLILDGGKVVGARDKDGFLKDTELWDAGFTKSLTDYVNKSGRETESDYNVLRGVNQSMGSILDFATMLYGAGKFKAFLKPTKLGLKMSDDALGNVAVGSISFGQMYGNNLKDYLDKGIDPGKAATYAAAKTGVSSLVESVIGPMESRLIAQGGSDIALANYRKVLDTTVDLIARGKLGTQDGLQLIGKSFGAYGKTFVTENLEEVFQNGTDKVSDFLFSGEKIEGMSMEEVMNTLFTTGLITIIPGIMAGVNTYKTGKADLITTALYEFSNDPNRLNRVIENIRNNDTEYNEDDLRKISSIAKMTPYIKEELDLYDVDKNKKVALTGLIASRYSAEQKLAATSNPKVKETITKNIESLNAEIDAVVNGTKKVEIDPSVADILDKEEETKEVKGTVVFEGDEKINPNYKVGDVVEFGNLGKVKITNIGKDDKGKDTFSYTRAEEAVKSKTFIGRDITDGMKIYSDFDNTLYNPKTGELTAVGKELRDKLDSGELTAEDAEILTARDAEQAKEISKFFPELTVKNSLSPEAKAAEVAKSNGNSIFIDDNKENLAATKSGEVIDSATVVPQAPTETLVENKPTEMVAEDSQDVSQKDDNTANTANILTTEREQATDVNKDVADSIKLTPKVKDILDEVTDEKIGEEEYQSFDINLSDGARSYGNITKDGVAQIVGIEAAKVGDGIERKSGTKVYERVLQQLSNEGVNTITVRSQSAASRKAINKLVDSGVLVNPRELTGVSTDEYPTKFDINKEELIKQTTEAPQTTKQGVSATPPEKVAPEASNEATGDVLPNFVAKNKAGGNVRAKTYKRTPEGKWQSIDKDGKVLANVGEAIAQQLEAERTNLRKATNSKNVPATEQVTKKPLTSREIDSERMRLNDITFAAKQRISRADDTDLAIKEYNDAKKAEEDFEIEVEKQNTKREIDRIIEDEKEQYDTDPNYEYKELFEKDPRLAALQSAEDMLEYAKTDDYVEDFEMSGVKNGKEFQKRSIDRNTKKIKDLKADLKENPNTPTVSVATTTTKQSPPNKTTEIEVKDVKLKKGADFDNDGTYEVTTKSGDVIGKIYYDKERKSWSDEEYVPKDANDIYGNNLGTKSEAIQAMVDRYNSKSKLAQKDGKTEQLPNVSAGSESNPALRDVESTAKALEEVKTPTLVDKIAKLIGATKFSSRKRRRAKGDTETERQQEIDEIVNKKPTSRIKIKGDEIIFQDGDSLYDKLISEGFTEKEAFGIIDAVQDFFPDEAMEFYPNEFKDENVEDISSIYEEEKFKRYINQQLNKDSYKRKITEAKKKVNKIKDGDFVFTNKSIDFIRKILSDVESGNVFIFTDTQLADLGVTKSNNKKIVNSFDISEEYHKAKADGSNPELVKAVEDLLSNTPSGTNTTETTTTTPEGVQTTTVLESVGKTEAEVIAQIQKFFTNSAAKNQKEAKEMATLNYKILEQIGKYFGGDAQAWIQAKLAKIGVISTVDEARALGRAQFQILGEKGAAALDAAEEANTRLNNLVVAKEMEAAGKDAKTIKLATGWEKGADSKYRLEVGDGKMIQGVDLTKEGLKLEDIYVNEELFKAYPQLSSMPVRLLDFPPDVNGGFNTAEGTLDLNKNKIGDALYRRELPKTLEHETTHVVQQIEGFNRGGNPQEFLRAIYDRLGDSQKFNDEYGNGAAETPEFKRAFERAIETTFRRDFKDLSELKDNSKDIFARKLANDMYNELAGEIEARSVEARMGMSPEQRRKSLLDDMAGIPKEEQIVILNSFDGLANSIAAAKAIQNQNAVFETRDGDVIGFNYDTDKVARERFDIPKLKKIGSGSDRDVYDLGNGKVLKVAKTARGLTQNIYEGDGILAGGITPEMYEGGLNYVVVDNVPNIKTTDVVMTYDWDGNELGETTAGEMLKEFSKFTQTDFDKNRNGVQDVVAKYGMQDILSNPVLWGDFTAKRNWGYKDGKAIHTDAGTFGGERMLNEFKGVKNLSDPEFREIYDKSRAAKKKYGDTDRNTMYQADVVNGYNKMKDSFFGGMEPNKNRLFFTDATNGFQYRGDSRADIVLYTEDGASLWLNEGADGYIIIEDFQVSKDKLGTGAGRDALTKLIKYADANNITLIGEPLAQVERGRDSKKGLDQKNLKEFYKRYGFGKISKEGLAKNRSAETVFFERKPVSNTNTKFQANNASVYESAAVSETINKNLIAELDRLIKEMSDPVMRKAKKISNEEALAQKRNLQAIRDGLVKAAADPRFQSDAEFRAATIELATGQMILAALNNPNASSFLHETNHLFSNDLEQADKDTLIKAYNDAFGEKETSISTDVSEYAARMWEKYFSNGRKLTSAEVKDTKTRKDLQNIFDKFTKWLAAVYNGVINYTNTKGVTQEVKVSKEVQDLFDKIMAITPTTGTGETAANTTTTTDTELEAAPVISSNEALEKLKAAAAKAFFGGGEVGVAFDPRQQGNMKADAFKELGAALVDYIKAKLAEGGFTKTEFLKQMKDGALGFPLEIPVEGADYLFNKAAIAEENTDDKKFSRTVRRILATPSIPENIKEAVRNGAIPKITITKEELRDLSNAVLAEIDAITDLKEAVKAYKELVDEMDNTITAKFEDAVKTGQRQFIYEIRTLKVIAQRLADLGQTSQAAEVLNKIAGIGTFHGSALNEMATVDGDPDAMFIVHFSKRAAKLNEKVLNNPINGEDGRTPQDAINEIVKSLTDELARVRAELDARIQAEVERVAQRPATKPTTTSKIKSKVLEDKAAEYLKKFRERLTSGTFKSVVPGVPTPEMLLAAKDFAMYAYYKFAGSIAKAKEAFLNEASLKSMHSEWDKVVSDLKDSGELGKADIEIAREIVFDAIKELPDVKPKTELTPAQKIAQRIIKIDKEIKGHNTKRGTKNKTNQEKIADNGIDQDTAKEIRDYIAGDALTLPVDKRADLMNQVDDILIGLMDKGRNLRAAPWITKTQVRKDLKEGLKTLGQTMSDLVKDFSDPDIYTDPIAQEFISRTGMSAAEAAPYIKVIEDAVKDIVGEALQKRLDLDVANAFDGDIKELEKAIAAKRELIKNLELKTRTDEELKELKRAKSSLKTLVAKLASTKKNMENRMNSPDFKRVLKAIERGGLNEDTVMKAFARRLGLEVLTKEQLDYFEYLRQKIADATMIIEGKQITSETLRNDAIKDLKKYIYRIKNNALLELIRQGFQSYMYANVLSSPTTAELAVFSGFKILFRDISANFLYAIGKDLGRVGTTGKLDLLHLRLWASAIGSMFSGDLKIASWKNAGGVLAGAEGITLQQQELQAKSKDRIDSTLSMIDFYNEEKNKLGNSAADKAQKLVYSTLIFQQQLARLLMVGDYTSRAAAIPYAAHQGLAQLAIESLPVTASAKEVYALIESRINAPGVDEIASNFENNYLTTTGRAMTSGQKEALKKRIKLDLLPSDIQNAVKEYADRIAFTGRATGFSGMFMNNLNGFLSKFDSNPIEVEDTFGTAAFKLGHSMAFSLFKMFTMPFPSVLSRGVQMLKNATPLGLFQKRYSPKDKDSRTWKDNIPIQWFHEHRYYGTNSSEPLEIIHTDPWERSSRYAWATLPTVGFMILFSSLFDFEDEEGNKSVDMFENFSSFFGFGKPKNIVLADNNNVIITSEYNTKYKEYYEGLGIQYEPYTIYTKNDKGAWKKMSIFGTYKDDSYGLFLRMLATSQERVLFSSLTPGEEGESSPKAKKDAYKTNNVIGAMVMSGIGFIGEYGAEGAMGFLKTLSLALSNKIDDKVELDNQLSRYLDAGVRPLIPVVGLGTYIGKVKGMYTGESRKKGLTAMEKSIAGYIGFNDLVKNRAYDALGYELPYQPSPYPVLRSVEQFVAAINNDRYTFYLDTYPFGQNTVAESRVTNAHRIRTKYSDIHNEISHFFPGDKTSGGQTVIKFTGSDKLNAEDKNLIAKKAADYKAEVLNREYEVLDLMSKEDLQKALAYVNDMSNQHAYAEYITQVVANNKFAMDKLGLSSLEDLRQRVSTDYQANLAGKLNVNDELVFTDAPTKKEPFRKIPSFNTFYRTSYNIFDKSVVGIVRLLKDNDLEIVKDGQIKFKDYDRIYNSIGMDRSGKSWKSIYKGSE